MTKRPTRVVWLLTVVVAVASLLYFASLTLYTFGYYHDDGIYVTTAKALATGQGYRIISLPYEPAQTKYPPFYPFLLSLIWRIDPQFPENLVPMILLSTIATIVFLTLSWLYLARENYATERQALLVVALTAMNWRIVILATNIYSEMLYSALSVGGLWLAEKNQGRQESWSKKFWLGLVLGLAFLTRTSGISLMIAVVLFYLIRKQFQKASLILAIAAAFVSSWTVWCVVNRTEIGSISVPYYTSYLRDFIERVGTLETLVGIIGINVFMLLFTSIPLVSLGISYDRIQNFTEANLIVTSLIFMGLTFLIVARGFLRHSSTGLRLLHIYVLLYFGLHLVWPFTSYERFLAPILPFLLLFLMAELKLVFDLVRRESASATGNQVRKQFSAVFLGLLLFALASVGSLSYATGIYRSLSPKETLSRRASEDRKAIQWIIVNTDPSAVLICYRDPQYYLYTGRKAVRSFLYAGLKAMPSFTSSSSPQDQIDAEKIILRIIKEHRGQYLVLTSSDFEQEYETELIRKTFETLIKKFPELFISEFQSTDGRTAIYSIRDAALSYSSDHEELS